ncbi:MAG: redoxin domain-containing protein [Chitinophagales bacterium]|nr:redoxin domain-containing protein [Chitinophagales bacterium]
MQKFCLSAVLLFTGLAVRSQQHLLNVGDNFPNYIIRPVVNAPVKEYDIVKENKKYLILNFWGTWCVPCIPEMDSLNRLQEMYKDKIHVIAVSNENTDRLENLLRKRPSKLWLAADTNSYLYNGFGFNYVGQSAIVDGNNRIIALVRTDSINQKFIDNLVQGTQVKSSAETGIASQAPAADYFGLDSSMTNSVTLCSARPKDFGSGSPDYSKTPFAGRRITYFNVPDAYLYNVAFGKKSSETFYEPDFHVVGAGKKIVCFDLLGSPGLEDSIKIIMQQELNEMLPFKAGIEKRKLSVYILKRKEFDTSTWKTSDAPEIFNMFSGKGFAGKAVPLSVYADYLASQLFVTVIDETGLKGKYDIITVNDIATKDEVLKENEKLGLTLEKAERELEVLIIFRPLN